MPIHNVLIFIPERILRAMMIACALIAGSVFAVGWVIAGELP